MNYKIIAEVDKKKVVEDFLRAQEMDHFCHTINAERYRKILADPKMTDGKFQAKIEKLLSETDERIKEIELIISNSA